MHHVRWPSLGGTGRCRAAAHRRSTCNFGQDLNEGEDIGVIQWFLTLFGTHSQALKHCIACRHGQVWVERRKHKGISPGVNFESKQNNMVQGMGPSNAIRPSNAPATRVPHSTYGSYCLLAWYRCSFSHRTPSGPCQHSAPARCHSIRIVVPLPNVS